MGIIDNELTNIVCYKPSDTYEALITSIESLKGYEIRQREDKLMIVNINKKMSAFSVGERIRASVSPLPDGTSEVKIILTPKSPIQTVTISGILKKHMDEIFSQLSLQLENYDPCVPNQRSDSQGDDVAGQIKKFADLRDSGILTEEEFNAKKKQLLGL